MPLLLMGSGKHFYGLAKPNLKGSYDIMHTIWRLDADPEVGDLPVFAVDLLNQAKRHEYGAR